MFLQVCAKPKVLIKITNTHCESFKKLWTVINECRLHALRRDIVTLNRNITFRHPANDIEKPFVVRLSMLTTFKSFSNINHTCPYVGVQLLLNFYPKNELVTLFLPSSDYILLMDWFLSKKKTFATNTPLTPS
ncbi:uncharacterized protein LOC126761884 [Bactrocera neohumeralis]|uniref:uncharacterized protein LOC126761884 n=1 Tax=Bactrocera neohumeralis TaxID=98809 RepID=UPI0021668692|nr:uncharacterized protein LOC126761884 [Bactrocera neohumeralis]